MATARPVPTNAPPTLVPIATVPRQAQAGQVGRWPGTWERILGAPIEPRLRAAVAWIEPEGGLLVWGGVADDGTPLMDGAIWHPGRGGWRAMAEAPLTPRSDVAWVWDRAGLFVYGGRSADGTWQTDGAWYSPEVEQWFPLIGDSPLPAGPAVADGDLNGIQVLVADPCGGAPYWAIWEPGDVEGEGLQPANVWSAAERPPLPAGARYEVVAADFDQALLVSYPAAGQPTAARYSRHPRRFRRLGLVPVPSAGATSVADRFATMAWSGTDAASGLPSVVVADLGRIRRPWMLTDVPPAEVAGDPALLVSPDAVISPRALLAWDLGSQRWRRIPKPRGWPRTDVMSAWGQGRLLLWGGRDAQGRLRDDGWAFRPSLGPGLLALPGGYPGGGDCGGQGINGVWSLRGDPDDPMLVWFQQRRRRTPTYWPDGHAVRFKGDTFVVLSPDGEVVAREGQTIREPAKRGDLDACWTGDSAWF